MDQSNDSAEGFGKTAVISWTGRGRVYKRRPEPKRPAQYRAGIADKDGDATVHLLVTVMHYTMHYAMHYTRCLVPHSTRSYAR